MTRFDMICHIPDIPAGGGGMGGWTNYGGEDMGEVWEGRQHHINQL